MTVQGTGADGAMVRAAGERLREGVAPVQVFVEFAARTADWRSSMWAVCLALGRPVADVEKRLGGEVDELFQHYCAGEEELCGEFLETGGVFDVPGSLDERGTEARRLLNLAAAAAGSMGSGIALGLSRRLFKGELTSAFLVLVRIGPDADRGRPAEFWRMLSGAGALLLPGDGKKDRTVERALEECRRRLADAPPDRP